MPYFGLITVWGPFYRFVTDPDSNPDSNPDPKCLFRIRIGSGHKFRIPPDPDPFRIRNTACHRYKNNEDRLFAIPASTFINVTFDHLNNWRTWRPREPKKDAFLLCNHTLTELKLLLFSNYCMSQNIYLESGSKLLIHYRPRSRNNSVHFGFKSIIFVQIEAENIVFPTFFYFILK